jgi:hypothetical protein
MKKKLTLTIDEDLIPRAKELAKSQRLSLSQLVEDLLRSAGTGQRQTFSEKWGGAFEVRDVAGDDRFDYLAAKYLRDP